MVNFELMGFAGTIICDGFILDGRTGIGLLVVVSANFSRISLLAGLKSMFLSLFWLLYFNSFGLRCRIEARSMIC